MLNLVEDRGNGIVENNGEESNFEPNPALEVGVQLQDLVKVR